MTQRSEHCHLIYALVIIKRPGILRSDARLNSKSDITAQQIMNENNQVQCIIINFKLNPQTIVS